MDMAIKSSATDILLNGMVEILDNYTKTALLINACFVSSERYSKLKGVTLSTTKNIPPEYRLEPEIDHYYTSKKLATEYTSSVLDIVYKNYIVMSISTMDAILEDLYELFLSHTDPDLTEAEVTKKIRDAWTNDNILEYFIMIGLKKPDDVKTDYREAFLRYKEIRIIRHTLIHSGGALTQKNIKSLEAFEKATPPERKQFAIINTPMISNQNRIVISGTTVYAIRKFLNSFLGFNLKSIENA